ncbi:Hypothetical protein NTJ_14562 [Nesidiocoris tenuis]|uniref:Uncharacterized protein n=1 Tax=Nesidiocoris tenuis TaxID=355587 RepID=A0ABN7BEZ5_9HEMI|nr:Hypothetical protein NTJ_14562 [Nesidiocoris tenuis]
MMYASSLSGCPAPPLAPSRSHLRRTPLIAYYIGAFSKRRTERDDCRRMRGSSPLNEDIRSIQRHPRLALGIPKQKHPLAG